VSRSKFFALLGLIITLAASSGFALFTDSTPIAFQSLESKTTAGKPIFNRVAFYSSKNRDVWVMQQSHSGYYEMFEKWDRIAIVVDKTKSPKTAQYYQLEPGDSVFEPSKKSSLKVSCYICHANGPRAIRADYSGKKLSVSNKLKLAVWNLRIKTYGKVIVDDSPNTDSKVPLTMSQPFDNETLKVKTCVKCHSDSGLIARGTLKRQHFMSIKFLVETGEMPPPGISLSESDRRQVLRFAQGL
jgi:hypothetical protein